MKKFLKYLESIIRKIKVFFYLNKKYGSTKPEYVNFPDYNTKVFINTNDWRAIKKLAFDFARSKIGRNIYFWRDFINHNNPEYCLDIGVNYGECMFSMEYNKNVKIIGVEANPLLIPYISKSIDHHTNSMQMRLFNNLLGDEYKKNCKFYANLEWSGKSSAIEDLNKNNQNKEFLVDQITLDSILENEKIDIDSLIFKLDVEGYEPFVLKGMKKTLSNTKKVIGYIEVDKNFLNSLEIPISLLDEIFNEYKLYWPNEKKGKTLKQINSLEFLFNEFNLEHTDIIVVKSEGSWLPKQWKVI